MNIIKHKVCSRCPLVDLAELQQLQQLQRLRLSLNQPGWCRIRLQAGWPECLSSLHLGSPMEICQLQGLGEPSRPDQLRVGSAWAQDQAA